MIGIRWLIAATCLGTPSAPAPVQGQSATAAGVLLPRLLGSWRMSGTVQGRRVEYLLDATRTLQGEFVELHMQEVRQPPQYEARVFVGADSSGALIAHWLDSFGPASSIPHGSGRVVGDTLWLLFRYPGAPFRDTFIYNRAANSWYFKLESQDSAGTWQLFAEYAVRRR